MLQDQQAAADRGDQQAAPRNVAEDRDEAARERNVPPSTGPRNDGSSQSSPPTAGIAAPTRARIIRPAPPAKRPESAWLVDNDALPTGTPDISAARALAPASEDLPADDGIAVEDDQRDRRSNAGEHSDGETKPTKCLQRAEVADLRRQAR